jgi:hypothetical protein
MILVKKGDDILRKIKDFLKNLPENKKEMLKKAAISIAITTTVVFSIFYIEVHIGNLVEFAGPIDIDVNTTINFY